MENVWIIQMDDYRHGTTFEVAPSREIAIAWINKNFSFKPKQMKQLNDSDSLTYGEESQPATINLVFCPLIKE